MKNIKKVMIHSFGDETQLSVVDTTIGDPQEREVQVRVEFSPVSGADINMRKGTYPLQRKAPLTPGYSLVGRVVKNGNQSGQFKLGQRVACLTIYDAQAELVNLPEKFLVAVPESVDPKQAAGIVLDWTTAYQMVHRVANVKKGDRVFIHGLSGSVGRAIFALAQLKGAEIFGTASERNHAELKKLGATALVYTDKNWIAEMQKMGGVDFAFDPLGFQSFDESYSILKNNGMLVAYGMNSGAFSNFRPRHFLAEFARVLAMNLKFWSKKRTSFYGANRSSRYFLSDVRTLMHMLELRQIEVPIKGVYPMAQVRQAHAAWGKSEGMGTLVLEIT